MNSFNFKIPQNIIFGMGSLNRLPELLAESGSGHVFLISDGGLAKLGVVEKIEAIIKAAGITCTTYLGVIPNPTVAVVDEATVLYKLLPKKITRYTILY